MRDPLRDQPLTFLMVTCHDGNFFYFKAKLCAAEMPYFGRGGLLCSTQETKENRKFLGAVQSCEKSGKTDFPVCPPITGLSES